MNRRVRVDDLIDRGYLMFETSLLRTFGGGWDDSLQGLLVPRELLLSRN